jgi:hypothetical protein
MCGCGLGSPELRSTCQETPAAPERSAQAVAARPREPGGGRTCRAHVRGPARERSHQRHFIGSLNFIGNCTSTWPERKHNPKTRKRAPLPTWFSFCYCPDTYVLASSPLFLGLFFTPSSTILPSRSCQLLDPLLSPPLSLSHQPAQRETREVVNHLIHMGHPK